MGDFKLGTKMAASICLAAGLSEEREFFARTHLYVNEIKSSIDKSRDFKRRERRRFD